MSGFRRWTGVRSEDCKVNLVMEREVSRQRQVSGIGAGSCGLTPNTKFGWNSGLRRGGFAGFDDG